MCVCACVFLRYKRRTNAKCSGALRPAEPHIFVSVFKCLLMDCITSVYVSALHDECIPRWRLLILTSALMYSK